jgi:hypothetical protein
LKVIEREGRNPCIWLILTKCHANTHHFCLNSICSYPMNSKWWSKKFWHQKTSQLTVRSYDVFELCYDNDHFILSLQKKRERDYQY